MARKFGRKNVRGKGGVRFNTPYTSSKHKAKLRNLVSELIVHERLEVTHAIAKDLSPLAERMITFAKAGDLHSRREAARVVRRIYVDKEKKVSALQKLFDELGPRYQDINGGYTRILKLENRKGDNAAMALIEFCEL